MKTDRIADILSSSAPENSVESAYNKLGKGDVVQVMVRGYRPEGEIYRVLFFVYDVANPGEIKGIYGTYEEYFDKVCPEFMPLSCIIAMEHVASAGSNARDVLSRLVSERNNLRHKIAKHNDFVKKNFLIGG